MVAQIRVGLSVALMLLLSGPVHADALQCRGGTVQEGDTRASLLQKCGPPQLQDSFCAPVFQNKSLVPTPPGSSAAPCEQIDDWTYDRSPSRPSTTVRLRAGAVQSIRPQNPPR